MIKQKTLNWLIIELKQMQEPEKWNSDLEKEYLNYSKFSLISTTP